MADPLFNIFKNVPQEELSSVFANAETYPPFISPLGNKKGYTKYLKGQYDPSTIAHEKFHQAQFVANAVEQIKNNPWYEGNPEAGSEAGDKYDSRFGEKWRDYLDRHDLSGIPIINKSSSEYPAYAFSSDPLRDLDKTFTPPFREWLTKNTQKAYDEYEKMVRSRNPTTANILSQATYPPLVRQNLATQPVPVPMQLPEVKADTTDGLLFLLKRLYGGK